MAAAALIAACESEPEATADDPPREEQAADPGRAGVAWDDYPPALKRIIDQDEKRGDCRALQATFDTWADSNVASPDLLDYIDEALRAADCY